MQQPIDLSAEEQELLTKAAALFGMTPEQYIQLLLRQHLQRLNSLGNKPDPRHS